MALLRNNHDPLNPKDNNMDWIQQQTENGQESTWSKLHNFFENGACTDQSFRQHAEHMLMFRKSHVFYQHTGNTFKMEGTLPIEVTANRNVNPSDLFKVKDWLSGFTENDALMHRFSKN
jgi:hypothetical protein